MNRRKLKDPSARNFRVRTPEKFVPTDESIVKLRIASGISVPNAVPVLVGNQSWPIFVFPDVYLDIQHLSSARLLDRTPKSNAKTVIIKFNEKGCERLSALANNMNLSTVLFIDNYPICNIAVPEKLYTAEFEINVFQNDEQAEYLVRRINEQKT